MSSGIRKQAGSGERSRKNHLENHVQGVHGPRLEEEPQYLIESDKTDHQAMHKGSALKKIGKSTAGPKKDGRAKTFFSGWGSPNREP